MGKQAFSKLAEKVSHHLKNGTHLKAHPDSVSVEVSLSMTLRWLAGGSYLDICDIHGVHEPTFFLVKERTLVALDHALANEIRFPKTEAEREAAAAGFSKNTNGVLDGCLSALEALPVHQEPPP